MNNLLHTFMALSLVSSVAFFGYCIAVVKDYSTETTNFANKLKTLACVSLIITFILFIIKVLGGF